ncbi:DUF5462 family protein [Vibrio sp. nBUS_14]|uniref:DUF5462 family protein n=1 Tax=Vibrio sp. nBUS_14 TaxID=3395321 RepID=UPI003EB82357
MLFLIRFIGMFFLLFSGFVFSSVHSVNNNINIGHVNGTFSNGHLLIKANVSASSIFYFSDVNGINKINVLKVVDSKFLDKSDGTLTIRGTHTQGNGVNLQSTVKIETFINNLKVNLVHESSGNDIYIYLPDYYKSIELKVAEPIEIILPTNYRGDLKVNFNVDGWKI